MNIQELAHQYARLPQLKALASELGKSSKSTVFLEGLLASSAPMLFASLAEKCPRRMLFVLQDAEEAGYFYHDLTQLMGTSDVLFFPSSYRRAVKYAQRDPASEILRTEVLTALSPKLGDDRGLNKGMSKASSDPQPPNFEEKPRLPHPRSHQGPDDCRC